MVGVHGIRRALHDLRAVTKNMVSGDSLSCTAHCVYWNVLNIFVGGFGCCEVENPNTKPYQRFSIARYSTHTQCFCITTQSKKYKDTHTYTQDVWTSRWKAEASQGAQEEGSSRHGRNRPCFQTKAKGGTTKAKRVGCQSVRKRTVG